MLGDLDAGYAARLEGARVAERVGSASQIRWFQGVLADHPTDAASGTRRCGRATNSCVPSTRARRTTSFSGLRHPRRDARRPRRLGRSDQRRRKRACRRPLHRATGCAVLRPVGLRTHLLPRVRPRPSVITRARVPRGREPRRRDEFAAVNLPTFASAARLLDLATSCDVLADQPRRPPGPRRHEPTRSTTSSPPPRSCIEPARGRRKPKPGSERPSSSWYWAVVPRPTRSCSRRSTSIARSEPRATSATARPCLPLPPSLVGAPAKRRCTSCFPARTQRGPSQHSSPRPRCC